MKNDLVLICFVRNDSNGKKKMKLAPMKYKDYSKVTYTASSNRDKNADIIMEVYNSPDDMEPTLGLGHILNNTKCPYEEFMLYVGTVSKELMQEDMEIYFWFYKDGFMRIFHCFSDDGRYFYGECIEPKAQTMHHKDALFEESVKLGECQLTYYKHVCANKALKSLDKIFPYDYEVERLCEEEERSEASMFDDADSFIASDDSEDVFYKEDEDEEDEDDEDESSSEDERMGCMRPEDGDRDRNLKFRSHLTRHY